MKKIKIKIKIIITITYISVNVLSVMELILETPEKVTDKNLEELIEKEVEEQIDAIDEEEYNESLDDMGEISVGNLTFYPSDIPISVFYFVFLTCMIFKGYGRKASFLLKCPPQAPKKYVLNPNPFHFLEFRTF